MEMEKTAENYYKKAEKKLDSWFLWKGNPEEAAELFEKAANSYKFIKSWNNAAEAYVRAAKCIINESPWEATTYFKNAGNCYKKTEPLKAIEVYKEASKLNIDCGKYNDAAKIINEIAEIYENEKMINEAIDNYKQAGELYKNEDSYACANHSILKAANLMATKEIKRYEEAILLYEEISDKLIDNNSLKWKVKENYLRAILCKLALGDTVGSLRSLEKYDDRDVLFASSREEKFLRQIINAIESYDIETFTNLVIEFDTITPLDSWKTGILLVIKQQIKTQSEEENMSLT